jgi:adenylate cyclase
MNPRNFFAELKRRNVYKVAVAYVVVGWLLIQAASILFPTFEAPPWVMKAFVAAAAFGFPIALMVAWAFEMTPQGMKRTENISPDEFIPQWSTRRFATLIATTVSLVFHGENDTEARFPAHHPLIGLGHPLQRKDFIHRLHTG